MHMEMESTTVVEPATKIRVTTKIFQGDSWADEVQILSLDGLGRLPEALAGLYVSDIKLWDIPTPHRDWDGNLNGRWGSRLRKDARPEERPVLLKICHGDSGLYSIEYKLVEVAPEKLESEVRKYAVLAVESHLAWTAQKRREGLIEGATKALFGGKYSMKWLQEDSKWHGLCGGKDHYSWELVGNRLDLWHRYSGVVQGLDGGPRTEWAIIHSVEFTESPEGNTFVLLK